MKYVNEGIPPLGMGNPCNPCNPCNPQCNPCNPLCFSDAL